MSLKAFHIIFVAASVGVSLFLGVWSALAYRNTGAPVHLVFAIASALAIVGLLIYGRYFLRKLKHISYL